MTSTSKTSTTWLALAATTAAALLLGSRIGAAPADEPTEVYVAEFVATAATGTAMNDAGEAVGTSYPDPGCGSRCLPPLETVVWRGGNRIVLPDVPGLTGITARAINRDAWVVGFAGFPYTLTRAVLWRPEGDGYRGSDLGTLPGTNVSEAIGIDDQGRVVGWSTTSNFPAQGSPFMWSEATGLVDLSAQGFPDEVPLAVGPGGTVATASAWYRLDDPGSVTPLPAPPRGFTIGTESTRINDAGDQARFLVSTSSQHLRYLFRLPHDGGWQQISDLPSGDLSSYGVGGITAEGDVLASVQGIVMVAEGPDGLAQPLLPLLSPAYLAASIDRAAAINASGQILAQVMIGRSDRLLRLTPSRLRAGSGWIVESLTMRGQYIEDPDDPGHCTENASNLAGVKIVVTGAGGERRAGVRVTGRFLDDYWTDAIVSGTTNPKGIVKFVHVGPCGVGAVAFFVDEVAAGAVGLDRTAGVLTGWVIPE